MNYFEFYDLPVSFKIDEGMLKERFYANSRKYHPDFFTLEPAAKQEEVLELATINNKAYRILTDPDSRMQYILDIQGVMEEEGKEKLPQDFLMEMMDINEVLMDLEFDFDREKLNQIRAKIDAFEAEIYESVKPVIDQYEDTPEGNASLSTVKEYFLKKRYLLRIKENLSKFATR